MYRLINDGILIYALLSSNNIYIISIKYINTLTCQLWFHLDSFINIASKKLIPFCCFPNFGPERWNSNILKHQLRFTITAPRLLPRRLRRGPSFCPKIGGLRLALAGFLVGRVHRGVVKLWVFVLCCFVGCFYVFSVWMGSKTLRVKAWNRKDTVSMCLHKMFWMELDRSLVELPSWLPAAFPSKVWKPHVWFSHFPCPNKNSNLSQHQDKGG